MEKLPPRRIPWVPILYLVFGIMWILASDSVVGWMFGSSPRMLVLVSTVKGFAFVALTALILVAWWRSEQKRTAALLQVAEARADLATERMAWLSRHANDIILLLDESGQILDCNERAERAYGYPRDELLGRAVFTLRPVDDNEQQLAQEHYRSVLDRGSLVFNSTHRRKDGTTFPVEVSSTRIQFRGTTYVASIVRDQTELVAARRRIERQRDLYDMLSRCNHIVARLQDRKAILDGVTRLAVENGRFLFAWIAEPGPGGSVIKSSVFGHDDGYVDQIAVSARSDVPSGQGPTGRSLRDGETVVVNRFLDDAMTKPWQGFARTLGIHASASVPIRMRGKVIAALMVYASEADFFDADIVATLQEIAAEIQFGFEALEIRKELEESRNLLQSVIDASAAPVYAYDRDGRCLLMNEACAQILGCKREAAIGRTRDAYMSSADVARNRANDKAALETGAPVMREETVGEGPEQRTFLSVKYPLRDLRGEIYGVGAVSTEITELRRAQQAVIAANQGLEETVALRTQQLVAARDRAEQADRAKTAFLSTVSHELRTPLNSMIGFTDIVLHELAGPLNDEQKRQLAIVQESSRMLLRLINEMLDLSRIEAGRLQLTLAPFDLAELLRKRVDAFASLTAEKTIALECEVDPQLTEMTSDAQRVAQIVTNLLSNATKFTSRGRIALRGRRDGALATIEVEDTGPGIARDDLALLFKPFVQVGEAQRTHREGTGLGLVISRHLARALGGDITVESEPGKGTCFRVTLPLQAPRRAAEPGDPSLVRGLADAT